MTDTAAKKPSIALIGLRGSGKSTVGRELARLLGGRAVDTDELLVERAGKSIAAVFEDEGETGFRSRERDIVAEVSSDPPAIISVGGGAVLDSRNVANLKATATIVWLTAPVETLWQRVREDPSTPSARPALTERRGLAELKHLLAQRRASYEAAADIVVDTMGHTPKQVARIIAEKLGRPR